MYYLYMSIYKVPGFLTSAECHMFIKEIESVKKSIPFTNSGLFKNNKYVDEVLCLQFYDKLLTYGIQDNLVRPNNLIMTGMYTPGDSFNIHTDTGLYYNEPAREKSRWTLLIYLNDVVGEGATVFLDDDWNVREKIYPVAGMGVLFDIDIWHLGEELRTQNKYWIGCEIIGTF